LVVADAAGGVSVLDGKSGDAIWSHDKTHDGGCLAAAVHPIGTKFATAGQDGRVCIWRANDPQAEHALSVGTDWVEHVAWSPDGRRLAVTCSRQAIVYEADGSELWRSEDHPSTISAIAWASSDELATACYGRVTFTDISTNEPRQKLEWQGSLVSMVLSADGDIVACGSQDNSVHFWRRSSGEDSMMHGYPSKPSSLAFDDSGQLLATSGGQAVTVWSFTGEGPEGTEPGVLKHHARTVSALAFARRGRTLASACRGGRVAVWSLSSDGSGQEVGAARLLDAVAELYWRPDGRALAALDARGGVHVWRASS